MVALRLGFLASHGGSGMKAIVNAIEDGRLKATPAVVISNNQGSEVMRFAASRQLPAYHLDDETHGDGLDQAVCTALTHHQANLVILSGYLKQVGPQTLSRFAKRILNIHPAPLPEFGGKGMYGLHVHEAVLASGRSESAASVHIVDEKYDHGPVIAQTRVPLRPVETPDTLAERIKPIEGELLVETLQRIEKGAITLA